MGFTRARVSATLRELLPHDFTLAGLHRRYVSVALSFELPRQDVILHPAQWSPDVPRRLRAAATQRPPRTTAYPEDAAHGNPAAIAPTRGPTCKKKGEPGRKVSRVSAANCSGGSAVGLAALVGGGLRYIQRVIAAVIFCSYRLP